MRLFLWICAGFLALAAPAQAAKVELNPEWGDAKYQAPSIFMPDRDAGLPEKDKVVVAFHGFRSAVPNGSFKRVYRKLKDTHTVIGVNYDYFDVEGTKALLMKLAQEELQGKEVVTFGTSLGAFWADWFGQEIGADKIVIANPVISPPLHLAQYLGETVYSERRDRSITVSGKDVDAYQPLMVRKNSPISMLVILSADDDILDYREAEELYAGRPDVTIKIYAEGGHSIRLKKHPALELIRAYVQDE